MLVKLLVKNFALIDEVQLNFSEGFSVITGETGSGKSILLNALHLLLAQRADTKVIGKASDKSIVEGEFEIASLNLEPFFKANDIDYFDQVIIRREINNQGRSRAFINDVPVQLTTLKELSEQLLSIHSQYNTLELKDKKYQMEVLDVLIGAKDLKNKFAASFKTFKSLMQANQQLKDELANAIKEKEYNAFLLNELESLQLEQIDFAQVEEQFRRLENAEDIQSAMVNCSNVLSMENGVIDNLNALRSSIAKLAKVDSRIDAVYNRLENSISELKDLDYVCQDIVDSSDLNEEKKNELQAKVDTYNALLLKHRVNTQEDLITIFQSLNQKVVGLTDLEERLVKNELDLKVANDQAFEEANKLHAFRVKHAGQVENNVKTLLEDLKLPGTRLKFELEQSPELSENGITKAAILFSANAGIDLIPIEKAASGGELSRVMLALQKMISEKQNMPTIFFDEIDTGVSGDVAEKIGNLLNNMGKHAQLFAISHLPQVAAKANQHYSVMKQQKNGLTVTSINLLTLEDRVTEIARLMSGETINEAAFLNAKALMN